MSQAVSRRRQHAVSGLARGGTARRTSRSAPKALKPSPLEWLTFALIRDAPRLPGGKYIGIESATVEPWPHQRIVAHRLIEAWPYSFLLCDEVGLREDDRVRAGHALALLVRLSQQHSDRGSRPSDWSVAARDGGKVLLAVRAGAVGQRRPACLAAAVCSRHSGTLALRPSVDDRFHRADGQGRPEAGSGARAWIRACGAGRGAVRAARQSHPRRRGHPHYNQLYAFTDRLLRAKSRALWLATATPMQLHEVEASDLVRLTRRAGAFLYDPSLTFCYYELSCQAAA